MIGARRWPVHAAQSLLVAVALLFPVTIMRGKSVTSDETAHLPAGYSYLTTGIVKLNPMHPPLVKELCALPLLALRPTLPIDRAELATTNFPLTYQWDFGKKFFYSQDADRLLFWGRVPVVLMSAGLAVLVALWAQRLWGATASLLALLLYVFDPTVTAHAQLVTTDVGMAFFGMLFLYVFRLYLAAPSRRGLLLSGITLGLALGAKFSGVLLLPVAAILLGLATWGDRDDPRTRRLGTRRPRTPAPSGPGLAPTLVNPLAGGPRSARLLCSLGVMAVLVVVAGIVLWVIYIFPRDPLFYWRGFQAVNQDHSPDYPYYLMGTLKPGGWTHYLLIAWLVKTPLPSLLLLAGAALVLVRGVRAAWLDEAFLIVPAVVFFVGYSVTADNMGVRYLIPVFPFLFVFTARVVPAVTSARRWAPVVVGVLLAWHVGEFISIWPDHLSYFNEIAGGPRGGPEWLDDSNVDWGQGLIQLREYLAAEGVRDYQLCYFGNAELQHYGIRAQSVTLPMAPGIVVLSTHCWARLRVQLERVVGRAEADRLVQRSPKAFVGHAYYVYEIPEPAARGAGVDLRDAATRAGAARPIESPPIEASPSFAK